MDDLPLQIGQRHSIVVDDADRADTRRREIKKQRRAEAAGADHQHARGLQRGLSRPAHLAQHDMARIAIKFVRPSASLQSGFSSKRHLLQTRLLHKPRRRGHLVRYLWCRRLEDLRHACTHYCMSACGALSLVISVPASAQRRNPTPSLQQSLRSSPRRSRQPSPKRNPRRSPQPSPRRSRTNPRRRRRRSPPPTAPPKSQLPQKPPAKPMPRSATPMPPCRLAERVAIQSDLIWSGDYNGGVTGEFGDRAIAAVKAFQKKQKGKETGILTPEERAALAGAVKSQREQVGWRIVEDPVMPGVFLGIPGKLVDRPPRAARAAAAGRRRAAKCRSKLSARASRTRRSRRCSNSRRKRRPIARPNTACCVPTSS